MQVGHSYIWLIATEDSAFKQRAWNATAVTHDWHCIWDHATCDLDKDRLMAIKSPHGSVWLFALPVSAFEIRLSDEAIRIAERCLQVAGLQDHATVRPSLRLGLTV